MNDIVTEATVPAEAVVAIAIDPVTSEPVEIKSEEVATVTSEGEVGEVLN